MQKIFTSRDLLDRILQFSRKLQSAQTGFLHLNYQALPEEQQDSIPLVENFLFALALLRSRTAENIQEAMVKQAVSEREKRANIL